MLNTDGISSATRSLLEASLSVAVPLWIERLRDKPFDFILERARECGQAVAERGDIIQFRSKKKGASAEAFNRLAEGLACAALVADGGVRFLGMHFEARREVNADLTEFGSTRVNQGQPGQDLTPSQIPVES